MFFPKQGEIFVTTQTNNDFNTMIGLNNIRGWIKRKKTKTNL